MAIHLSPSGVHLRLYDRLSVYLPGRPCQFLVIIKARPGIPLLLEVSFVTYEKTRTNLGIYEVDSAYVYTNVYIY